MHRTTGALANQPHAVAVMEPPPVTRPVNWQDPVQGSLFPSKVVSMPTRGPAPRTTRPRAAANATTGVAGRSQNKRPPRPPVEGQGELDFLTPVQTKPKTLTTTVDAVIYCEAPVATPLHRATAAIIDWSLVLIAYGLFLGVFALRGGEFVLSRPNLLIFGGALAVVALLYGVFWTIAGTETFGMRFTQLRVITFDGFPPDNRQRYARLAGTCLSLFSVLGILWCLADEEGLGWQDHISRTFPTPYGLESRVYRRG